MLVAQLQPDREILRPPMDLAVEGNCRNWLVSASYLHSTIICDRVPGEYSFRGHYRACLGVTPRDANPLPRRRGRVVNGNPLRLCSCSTDAGPFYPTWHLDDGGTANYQAGAVGPRPVR